MRSPRLFLLAFFALVSPSLTGCASFPGGELPERSSADIQAPGEQQSVNVQFQWLTQGSENATVTEVIAPGVLDVMTDSGLFSAVREGSAPADYQFDISIDNTGNRLVAGVTGFLSGLTLFALPGYARDNYTMQVNVNKAGVPVGAYTYEDHLTSWFQWVMIFFTFTHSISDAPQEIVENMTWNLLYDLQRDSVLQMQQ